MPQGMVQKNKIEEERRQQGRGWWESIQTKSKGILDDVLILVKGCLTGGSKASLHLMLLGVAALRLRTEMKRR